MPPNPNPNPNPSDQRQMSVGTVQMPRRTRDDIRDWSAVSVTYSVTSKGATTGG